ncbi:folylpolyglutamate synthase [Lecanora helva]
MIELGLGRITRLLKDTPIPWRAIHVAGTNGKGSVCAYVSAMLKAGNIKCGRFTSPHLIDRWDCITVDEATVDKCLFHTVEAAVKARDLAENIKASEFELLTATAFEIFNREKVDVGVIEVGLGGRHDATNVLSTPSVTVITKIGKDHQAILGHRLEDIAYQKAGIMKQGAPCIVDGSNDSVVLDILEQNARDVGVTPLMIVDPDPSQSSLIWNTLSRDTFESHQRTNIYLAFKAISEYLAQVYPSLEAWRLSPAIASTIWPGRLQTIDIESAVGHTQKVLLDGAHNEQSADILGSYVDRKIREKDRPVTWLVAMSTGRDIQQLLSRFIRPGDNLLASEFGPVDGMPWVSAHKASVISSVGQKLGDLGHVQEASNSTADALRQAASVAAGGPLVIAGSLYLVSDILRLLRQLQIDCR